MGGQDKKEVRPVSPHCSFPGSPGLGVRSSVEGAAEKLVVWTGTGWVRGAGASRLERESRVGIGNPHPLHSSEAPN